MKGVIVLLQEFSGSVAHGARVMPHEESFVVSNLAVGLPFGLAGNLWRIGAAQERRDERRYLH